MKRNESVIGFESLTTTCPSLYPQLYKVHIATHRTFAQSYISALAGPQVTLDSTSPDLLKPLELLHPLLVSVRRE
jgi:hypothetical protein